MGNKKKLWASFNLIRTLPALLAYKTSPRRDVIDKDIAAWIRILKLNSLGNMWSRLNWLMVFYPEYRNLFYNRIKADRFFTAAFLRVFYRPMKYLYIATFDIGGGLFIQHGFSTGFSPKSMGENCWINQMVSIGFAKVDQDSPVIGDRVKIGTGAIILGDITIGDDSTIGAGAVVTKDVPPNCTVIGNPAYIVKKDSERVKIPL